MEKIMKSEQRDGDQLAGMHSPEAARVLAAITDGSLKQDNVRSRVQPSPLVRPYNNELKQFLASKFDPDGQVTRKFEELRSRQRAKSENMFRKASADTLAESETQGIALRKEFAAHTAHKFR